MFALQVLKQSLGFQTLVHPQLRTDPFPYFRKGILACPPGVLYPQLTGLALQTPQGLEKNCPVAFAALAGSGLWNRQAEAALFAELL